MFCESPSLTEFPEFFYYIISSEKKHNLHRKFNSKAHLENGNLCLIELVVDQITQGVLSYT